MRAATTAAAVMFLVFAVFPDRADIIVASPTIGDSWLNSDRTGSSPTTTFRVSPIRNTGSDKPETGQRGGETSNESADTASSRNQDGRDSGATDADSSSSERNTDRETTARDTQRDYGDREEPREQTPNEAEGRDNWDRDEKPREKPREYERDNPEDEDPIGECS